MKYTVEITKIGNQVGIIKGIASVVLGDAVKITGLRIKENRNGELYIQMPGHMTSDDHYRILCMPIDEEFHNELMQSILHVFDKRLMTVHTFGEETPMKIRVTAKVTTFEEKNRIKGIAKVVLDEKYVLNSVFIKESQEGHLYVDYPVYRTKYRDAEDKPVYASVFYPVTAEWAGKIRGKVMDEYYKSLAETVGKTPEEKMRGVKRGR